MYILDGKAKPSSLEELIKTSQERKARLSCEKTIGGTYVVLHVNDRGLSRRPPDHSR